jgi:hypothetical protein
MGPKQVSKGAVAKGRELIEVSAFNGSKSVSWHRSSEIISGCQAWFSVFIIIGQLCFCCWTQVVE